MSSYPHNIFNQKKQCHNCRRATENEDAEPTTVASGTESKTYYEDDKDGIWEVGVSDKEKVIDATSLPCKCSSISVITGGVSNGGGAINMLMMNGSHIMNSTLSPSSLSQNARQQYLSSSSSPDWMAPFRNTICRYLPFNRRRVKKSTWRNVALLVLVLIFVVCIQMTFGVFQRCFLEQSFKEGFKFPLDVSDFPGVVKRYILAAGKGSEASFQPSPVNTNYSGVSFIQGATSVFYNSSQVGLLIIVKSATRNYRKRMAIRKTWSDPTYLQNHFMSEELPTKVAFICGIPDDFQNDLSTPDVNELFPDEKEYGDIVLANFQDSYGNNTYKTLLLMRWVLEQVGNFKYLMIVDDDMYISPANAISFIKNVPTSNLQTVVSGGSGVSVFYPETQFELNNTRNGDQIGPLVPLKNQPLIMGSLCVDAKPFRNYVGAGSKWSISVSEYPYDYFPPYIAGAATIMDRVTVAYLYYGSMFTRHFWIDDVYIGIIARKLGITLTGNDKFDSSYRGPRNHLKHDLKDMIAVHGLACPEQLVEVWNTMDIERLHDCSELTHLL